MTLEEHTHDGQHCMHWQDGDGDCCDCGKPNWCPDEGEDFAEHIPDLALIPRKDTP